MAKYVIKRNKQEVPFDIRKIKTAIEAANGSVSEENKIDTTIIDSIVSEVNNKCLETPHSLDVEEIQDLVEKALMNNKAFEVAQSYIRYRYKRMLSRQMNTTDEKILTLVDDCNEEAKQENSNKNPTRASTQRDYIAGEVSRDITDRILLPDDIVKANKEGIIHFHDSDYYITRMYNCCLVNIDDMLQNGTVISGTKIEKPHSFSTACNITSQIIAQVASSQYGGQSITLSHLAPFVDISRQKIKIAVKKELAGLNYSEDKFNEIVNNRVKKEITRGVQTLQYQILTLLTTNGQAPFVTLFMYLNEVPEGQLRDDLAMIIEEVIKQRYQGVKNEEGVWITPAFPKLIYVLEEDNIKEGTKYWYLTKLAAKCTAKRMVPDYISEKIMIQNKVDKNGEGHCYACMGCVDKDEVITYKFKDMLFVESFKRFWDKMSSVFEIKLQENGIDEYINLRDVKIYDKNNGFVACHRLIKNHTNKWIDITFSNGRYLRCTPDHPLPTNRGRVFAKDIVLGDEININNTQYSESFKLVPKDLAWAYGVLLCDSSISSTINASFAMTGEDDIIQKLADVIVSHFHYDYKIIEHNRGKKGNYKDLRFYKSDSLRYNLIRTYEGLIKNERHIPNEVFTWDTEAKYAFLAGMIDSDGYINNNTATCKVQIGSINKELAIQQMLLAQALGMKASMYVNHYNSKSKDKIRYRVEFVPDDILLSYIVCDKKKANIINNERKNKSISESDKSIVTGLMYKDVENEYSYDVTTESDFFDVSGIYSHNCRSFLTPYIDENGRPKYYGRFNQGVVTINLVDAGLSAHKNLEKFWTILDERLELCHKALRCRHERLCGTKSDIAPILWQYGAIARLNKGEVIDRYLYGGYSTISLGYAGLWECVYSLIGKKLTEPEGEALGLKIMQKLNEYTAKWKAAENIDYSLYGTPLESTTYKFAKCLQKRFGVIKGVTDKNYITNSYHVHVTEPIDAFDKLTVESKFQLLSPGGAISYVEVPNMQNNISAVLNVMQFIYENIMYAELNTKSDYCQMCGYDGEIKIVEQNGKLIWVCPNCGNTDQEKLNIARRTCGYIGTQFWNQGRTQEIKERVLHL